MTPPVTGCAYFLDIDGTLVDFADAPAHVRLHRALPGLVDALYRSSGGAVAFITGRSLADVDRLFPARRLPAAGQQVLERRTANGRENGTNALLDPAGKHHVGLYCRVRRRPGVPRPRRPSP